MAERHPTLVEDGDAVLILDQTRLPREATMLAWQLSKTPPTPYASCRCAARR
jgi:hypothetical protein